MIIFLGTWDQHYQYWISQDFPSKFSVSSLYPSPRMSWYYSTPLCGCLATSLSSASPSQPLLPDPQSLHGTRSASQHSFPCDFGRSQGKLFEVKLRLCRPTRSRVDPGVWRACSKKSTPVSPYVSQENVKVSVATWHSASLNFDFIAFSSYLPSATA